MTDQQDQILEEVLNKRGRVKNSSPAQPEGSYLGNLGRSAIGQGLLLGFGDELEAGFKASMSRFTDDPKTYKEIRDGVRAQIKQSR